MKGQNPDTNLEKEFANSTSLHGIARVANNTRVSVKLSWLSIMMVCFGVCVYQVHDRISSYFMYTANTAISVEYTSNLNFPAVTICNFNRYRNSQVLPKEYKYMKYISTTYTYDADDLAELAASDFSQGENSSKKFNFTEFTMRAGFSISQSLMYCRWRGKTCYAENFTHVFTPLGNCWTFNSGKDSPILQAHRAGEGNGLTVFINIEQDDYTETITSNFQAGLKVVIHDQHTPPLMESSLAIPPGVHAFVGVRRQQYLNLEKPHGKCDASQKLKRFQKYTLEACTIECLIEVIVEMCRCRPVGYPGNETECSPFQERNCTFEVVAKVHSGETGDCKCTVPCNHTAFQTSLSSAVIPNKKSSEVLTAKLSSAYNKSFSNELFEDYVDFNERYIRDNIVMLSVYYEELNFQLYQQTKAYTMSALVSDIGGQLGLFLGASFITLAEILSYITHRVKRCFGVKTVPERAATQPDKRKIEVVTVNGAL